MQQRLKERQNFSPVLTNCCLPKQILKFWKLETVGIHDSQADPQDNEILKSFHETLLYDDGRYYVSWPWKYEFPQLPENRELAFGRPKSLVRKLKNNCKLVKQYNSVIQDQFRHGIIERVKPGPTDSIIHYIPRHAVINPSKTRAKERVAYDASARVK